MKKMKRLVALALSVVMVLAMSVFASAADTKSNVDLTKHTFSAYQIFSGTWDSESKNLSDIDWGDGVVASSLMDALQEQEAFKPCKSAADVAAVLKNYNDTQLKAFTKIVSENTSDQAISSNTNGTITLPAAGYYLIVDTTNVSGDKDDAKNLSLLKVSGAETVTPEAKTDKPSVEKKVKENNKIENTTGDFGTQYNDVADYNIGDEVPFKLIGTVPDMDAYQTYEYQFIDELSEGLTLNQDSIKVYLASKKDGTAQDEIKNPESGDPIWSISNATEHGFEVKFNDLKKVANVAKGKYIIVEYTATLNESAKIGLPGNTNEVYLKYSNNPNGSGIGKTPEDKVIVFTYELDVNKVDKDTKKGLKDAEFKLYKTVNGKNYYAQVANEKVTGWTDKKANGTELTSDANGCFKVKGLDDGTYYLEETKAPSGYNKLKDPITLVINGTTNNTQKWTEEPNNKEPKDVLDTIKVKVDTQDEVESEDTNHGIVKIDVENSTGSQLPSTGGIGTTIFYIVGGILMVGAAVLLITKRRAEN